eukprot:PhF_6_TR8876/c0_g1_i1/m.14045
MERRIPLRPHTFSELNFTTEGSRPCIPFTKYALSPDGTSTYNRAVSCGPESVTTEQRFLSVDDPTVTYTPCSVKSGPSIDLDVVSLHDPIFQTPENIIVVEGTPTVTDLQRRELILNSGERQFVSPTTLVDQQTPTTPAPNRDVLVHALEEARGTIQALHDALRCANLRVDELTLENTFLCKGLADKSVSLAEVRAELDTAKCEIAKLSCRGNAKEASPAVIKRPPPVLRRANPKESN